MRTKPNICSIFGQIEGIVADAMAREGKVRRIPVEQIPESVLYDERGNMANCALIFFTPGAETEFDERVAAMYA